MLSRINNILYKDGIPVIKLHQKFVDQDPLIGQPLDYMNKYLEMFPELHTKINKDMPKKIIIFYDLETTGTNVKIHGIHQIFGIIEVDGIVVDQFNYKVRPNPKAKIEQEALDVCKVTEEEILEYPEMKRVYLKLLSLLEQYVDRFNPKDKMWLCGFNNRGFDDQFLRSWFEQNGDSFFGSFFWSDSLDTLVLASQYLMDRRSNMPHFKLRGVARELGLEVDEDKLHDALYDVTLTRDIYRIVTGLEYEL